MNIFGLGPGELLLIAILALVVVGPERMPELARRAGQMLVSARNWIRASPDATMVLRMRQEIENELATLRSSLAEVQNVRDEIVGAAKQVTQTVETDLVKPFQQATESAKAIPRGRTRDLAVDPSLAPQQGEDGALASAAPVADPALPSADPAVADDAVALAEVEPRIAPPELAPHGAEVVSAELVPNGVEFAPPPPPATPTDLERHALLLELGRLTSRLDDLAGDIRAMQETLRQREAQPRGDNP